MPQLVDYQRVVGPQIMEELKILADRLKGKHVLHVNSTAVGGGVAEILNCMVPLMNELGIQTRWDVIKGGEAFYAVTKKIHNALHGDSPLFQEEDFRLFMDVQAQNLRNMPLNEDIIFIHDPQPLGLVERKKTLHNKWIWRCHVDVSSPDPALWAFLKPMIESYDKAIFSAPVFSRQLAIPQVLASPSIDPLSDKNREMSEEEALGIMRRLNIPLDKPLVTQVSRFDHLKDPLGVVKAFKMIKNYVDARLLLVGGTAADDPEGAEVFQEVKEAAAGDEDILILLLPPTSHLEINAIQRASTLIVQKSIREGFGLTITEALWKGKPVIASAVGGIPLQITHKYSGILTHSIEGTSYWLKQLLQDPISAKRLGENGKEHVAQNFLLTRHLRDYLLVFLSLFHDGENVNL
jgi:trehalose synthase